MVQALHEKRDSASDSVQLEPQSRDVFPISQASDETDSVTDYNSWQHRLLRSRLMQSLKSKVGVTLLLCLLYSLCFLVWLLGALNSNFETISSLRESRFSNNRSETEYYLEPRNASLSYNDALLDSKTETNEP